MSFDLDAMESFAATQDPIEVTVVDAKTKKEKVLKTDFMEFAMSSTANWDTCYGKYLASVKKSGGDTTSMTSISYLITVSADGESVILKSAFSFGRGGGPELDSIKMRHAICEKRNVGSVTHQMRLPTNSIALLKKWGAELYDVPVAKKAPKPEKKES
jgi:hypothetical protein